MEWGETSNAYGWKWSKLAANSDCFMYSFFYWCVTKDSSILKFNESWNYISLWVLCGERYIYFLVAEEFFTLKMGFGLGSFQKYGYICRDGVEYDMNIHCYCRYDIKYGLEICIECLAPDGWLRSEFWLLRYMYKRIAKFNIATI
jgi:hypothetical protein